MKAPKIELRKIKASELIPGVQFRIVGRKRFFYVNKITEIAETEDMGPAIEAEHGTGIKITMEKDLEVVLHKDSRNYYYYEMYKKRQRALMGTFVPGSDNMLIYWGYFGSYASVCKCWVIGLMYRRECWPAYKFVFKTRAYKPAITDDVEMLFSRAKKEVKIPEKIDVLMLYDQGVISPYVPEPVDLQVNDWHRIQDR